MRIDEFLAAGNFIEIDRRIRYGVEAAHVRYHRDRVESAVGHHLEGFLDIVRVATRGSDEVVGLVVHVVEVEQCGERRVGRAGEKIEATVRAEQPIAHLYDALHRREYEDVVEKLPPVQGLQMGCRVGDIFRINVMKLDAVALRLLDGEDRGRAREAGVVDIGDDDSRRLAGSVHRVIDGAHSHGAHACEEGEGSAFPDAHLVRVGAGLCMVLGVIGAHDAGDRLGEGAHEEGVGLVFEEAA